MSDQGEKIIFLARELLNADAPATPLKKMKISVSFRTLCLTTFLAAAAGGVVGHFMQIDEQPLTRYEKTEIDALVFYTAKVKGLDETALRRSVAQKVGAAGYDDINAREFSEARRYLQEQAQ